MSNKKENGKEEPAVTAEAYRGSTAESLGISIEKDNRLAHTVSSLTVKTLVNGRPVSDLFNEILEELEDEDLTEAEILYVGYQLGRIFITLTSGKE